MRSANIVTWATRLNSGAKRVYPSQLGFNQDYNDPKFKPGKPLALRQAAGRDRSSARALPAKSTCSARSLPGRCWRCAAATRSPAAKPSRAGGVPSCVRPIMRPMRATGTTSRRGRTAYTGLGDGPLTVIKSLNLARRGAGQAGAAPSSSPTRSGLQAHVGRPSRAGQVDAAEVREAGDLLPQRRQRVVAGPQRQAALHRH